MSFVRGWVRGVAVAAAVLVATVEVSAQTAVHEGEASVVTFTKDVAPVLQANCVTCHREGGVAPMALETYEQARPWAPMMKYKTGLRDRMGAMPPYYMERGVGIQEYRDDERLSEAEIETIAAWVDDGAVQGDPADMPPLRVWTEANVWTLEEPDLIVRTEDVFMEGGSPDWWGQVEPIPTGLMEDRYVRAVEFREINDAGDRGEGETVIGGRWIFHHLNWSTIVFEEDGSRAHEQRWSTHELGRNPDIFDPRAGYILKANSSVVSNTAHLHSNGVDTRASLEIGFYFHPKGYEPAYPGFRGGIADGMNIDIAGTQSGQELHAYKVLDEHWKLTSYEPHLHAPGERMCLEAIWGTLRETLACVGYDHNWVRQYTWHPDHSPILPKGTILHLIGYMDTSLSNSNVIDSRNWSGPGNRSVANMFLDLGMRVSLTDEQLVAEMAERRERLNLTKNDWVIGCPLCMADLPLLPQPQPAAAGGGD